MLHVQITLTDGTKRISEFERLRGIRKLSADVFSGRKAFPVWRPVSNTHPTSGEPGFMTRHREFVAGSQIQSMEVVTPSVDEHNFDPDNFVPEVITSVTRSPGGSRPPLWTVPEGADIPHAEPGTQYPIHRDRNYRRYVYLLWAPDFEDATVHYLDPEGPSGAFESSRPANIRIDDDEEYDDEEYVEETYG